VDTIEEINEVCSRKINSNRGNSNRGSRYRIKREGVLNDNTDKWMKKEPRREDKRSHNQKYESVILGEALIETEWSKDVIWK